MTWAVNSPGLVSLTRDVALRSARIGQRDAIGDIFHGLPLDPDGASGGACAKGLFFECRLFHQPMGEPPEEVEIGTAVIVAPRPQPGVIGQKKRHPPFLLAAQDQERQIVGARHQRRPGLDLRSDDPQPFAPGRRLRLGAWKLAGDRMAVAGIGDPRPVGLLDDAPIRERPE